MNQFNGEKELKQTKVPKLTTVGDFIREGLINLNTLFDLDLVSQDLVLVGYVGYANYNDASSLVLNKKRITRIQRIEKTHTDPIQSYTRNPFLVTFDDGLTVQLDQGFDFDEHYYFKLHSTKKEDGTTGVGWLYAMFNIYKKDSFILSIKNQLLGK